MLNAQEETSVDDLRYQLGALVARSEVELNIFYQLFDAYVEKHTYHPPAEEDSLTPTGPDRKQLYRILAFTPLFLAIIGTGIWFFFVRNVVVPFQCPGEGKYTIDANITATRVYNQAANFQFKSISSDTEGFQEHLTPDNVRLEWDLGDGTMLVDSNFTDSSKTYRYVDAGIYETELRVIINDTCVCRKRETRTIRLDDRLRPDFSVDEIQADSFQFNENSYYFSSPDSLRPSDTTKVSFRWDFGDGQTSNERNPAHKYEDVSEYEVKLEIRAEWADTVVTDIQTRQVSNMPKPKLGFVELEDEDISDLLPPANRNPIPFILGLAALISYLIYEIIRAWQRKIALEEAPLRGPPLRQPLELDPPTLDFLHTQDFYELSRKLRRRREGRGGLRPNIPRSIEETAQAGGFPTLEWHKRTHASQYLILMKEGSKYDHLVQLFVAMAREWEARDISVALYTYERNPRLCKRVNGKKRLPLSQLHNLYPNDRLIVIGEGEELLSEEGDALAPWTEDFDNWTQRAWLSSKSTEAWGQSEQILNRQFLLLPATQTGMQSLVQQWEADEKHELPWWQRNHLELSPPDPESPNIISELKIYLGEAGFQWLAACAWYPELRWELSLQLGKLIEVHHPDAPLQELDYLIHLLRLSYFREGSMSRELREQLVVELPETQSKAVREHLLDLLQQARNQPPPDSYAAVDQQVRIALFRYLNSEKDGQAQKALRDAIKDLEPEDIEDQISLSELSKIKNSPLALILPARYFRGHVPFFGLRQKIRMLLVGIPLLLMAGLGNYMSFWVDEVVYEPRSIYSANELQLEDGADSTRWNIHNGYVQSKRDSALIASGGMSREAINYFKRALVLQDLQVGPDPILFILSNTLRPKVLNNFCISYYNYAVHAYEDEAFQTVIDSLKHSINLLSSVDRGRREAHKAQLWLPYAMGMSHLRMQQNADAIRMLQTVFCSTILDIAYQQNMIDSLLMQDDVRSILQLLNTDRSATNAASLLECIGGTYAYEVTVFTASESQANTDDPVQMRINGSIENMNVRLDNGAGSLNRGKSLTRTFRNLDYLGDIQSIQLRLPDRLQSANVDDWKADRIIIRDVQTNQTYTFCPTDWIGDEERGRSRELVVSSGCAISTPDTTAQQDSIVAIPYVIAVQDGLGEPLPTANVQVQIAGTPPRAYTGAYVNDTLRVSSALLDSLRRLNTTIPAANVAASANGYASSDMDVLIPRVNDTVVMKLLLRPTIEGEPTTDSDVPKPRMIPIKGGTYQMGNLFEGEGNNDETPHEVTVSDFEMGAFEVSFAEFDRFCDSTGYYRPRDIWGRGQQPVIYVDWYDATLYCNWLSAQHGYEQVYTIDSTRQDPNNQNEKGTNLDQDNRKWLVRVNWNANGYRLPTEAEWEYAAREGGKKVRFGNGRDTADAKQINFDATESYEEPYSKVGQYRGQTVEVNSFDPNALGLYNMSGNLDEWCWDWYGAAYYSQSQNAQNPRGPSSGKDRVIRGGSFGKIPYDSRVAGRDRSYPIARYISIGFRLLRRSR